MGPARQCWSISFEISTWPAGDVVKIVSLVVVADAASARDIIADKIVIGVAVTTRCAILRQSGIFCEFLQTIENVKGAKPTELPDERRYWILAML